MNSNAEGDSEKSLLRFESFREKRSLASIIVVFLGIAFQPLWEAEAVTREASAYLGALAAVGILASVFLEDAIDSRLPTWLFLAASHVVCLKWDQAVHGVLLRACSLLVFPFSVAKDSEITVYVVYLVLHFLFSAYHVGSEPEGWQWLAILLVHDVLLIDFSLSMKSQRETQIHLSNTSQVVKSLLGSVCDGCLLLTESAIIVGADPKASGLLYMEAEATEFPGAPRIGSLLEGALENNRLVRGLRMLSLPTGGIEERIQVEAYVIPCPMSPKDAMSLGFRTAESPDWAAGRVHLCAFRLADGGFEPKATPSAAQIAMAPRIPRMGGMLAGGPMSSPSRGGASGVGVGGQNGPVLGEKHGNIIQMEGSVVDSGLCSPRTQAASAVGVGGKGGMTPAHPGIPLNAIQAVGLGVGSYTKVRVVGRGSQGQVWQVTGADGMTYAQKEIGLKGVLWHRDFPKRLRDADREVRTLKGLAWASSVVVPIVDCWISKDFEMSCIVMEWLPKNLDNVLKKLRSEGQRTVPSSVACNWLARLSAGLGAIHAAGFIHRDLKPSNILLDESLQQCKITDLGVSRALHRQRDTPERRDGSSAVGSQISKTEAHDEKFSMLSENMGSILSGYTVRPGTIAYSSPEANETCHYGSAADIFSFGVVAMEMLSLQTPPEPGLGEVFAPTHTMDLAKQMLGEIPPGFDPSTWAELKRLTIWMLRPRAEDRPSARDLATNRCLVAYVEQLARDCPKLRILLLQSSER